MIQDLHAHTYYSFCSNDTPVAIVEQAIAGGISQLGFCDHNYGIGCARTDFCWNKGTNLDADYGKTLLRYYDHISLIKEKYKNEIQILRGIEICTLKGKDDYALPKNTDVSFFDFALVENLDNSNSIIQGDLIGYAKQLNTKVGIAHTDLFNYIETINESHERYLKKLADNDIFWEINVNYDSVHSFKTHEYVADFFNDQKKQELVKKSGLKLSVGFDSHIAKEYKPIRIHQACQLIKKIGIPLMFEDSF